MDRGKRPISNVMGKNSKIYMDLKDIIMEYALPFLPAKSIFRFTGVCRDWKMQISTPFFAHKQSNSFSAMSGLFYQSKGDPTSFVSLDRNAYGVPDPSLNFLPEEVDIRCSSNGLVCCQGRVGVKAYYICNPVTKQWKKLSKPNADHGPNPAIVLIFEPSILSFVAEYTLVCAFPSADFENGLEFEIYSSSKGSWRISGEIFLGNRKLVPTSGVYVNNIVYWLTGQYGIFAFDLMKERVQVLSSWPGCLTSTTTLCLGVMHGKLCVFSINKQQLTVSVLSNVHSNTIGTLGVHSNMAMFSSTKTWEEKCRIPLISATGISYESAAVVFGGNDVVVIRGVRGLICYNMKTNENAVLCSAAESDARCVAYVNSLVYF